MILIFSVLNVLLMSAAAVLSSAFARQIGTRAYFNGITVAILLGVVTRVDQLLIVIDNDYANILPPAHGLDTFNTNILSLAIAICVVLGLVEAVAKVRACKRRSAREEAEREAEIKVKQLSNKDVI